MNIKIISCIQGVSLLILHTSFLLGVYRYPVMIYIYNLIEIAIMQYLQLYPQTLYVVGTAFYLNRFLVIWVMFVLYDCHIFFLYYVPLWSRWFFFQIKWNRGLGLDALNMSLIRYGNLILNCQRE